MMLEYSENVMAETEISSEPTLSEDTISKRKSRKKKNKMPAVIVAVLAVIVLAGVGIFVVPKLFSSKTIGNLSKSENYSKLDEEQIASIISEAEALALKEDYESAIAKIQAGLVNYPKSVELQNKVDEYTKYLNAQIKKNTLAEAKSLADSGDYVGAINKIGEAKAVIGDDQELEKQAKEYEDNYIKGVISESNDLLYENKYTEAIALINTTLTEFPNNQKLLEQRTTIQNSMPKSFMDACPPYEMNKDTTIHTGNSSFTMSGERYQSGITMEIFEHGSWFLSNLKGEYSELQFYLGHVDQSGMTNVTLTILLDDVPYMSYDISSYGLPEQITIPVANVKHLKAYAVMEGGLDNYAGYPTIGLGNITIK